jgi:hypothetical protein
MAFTPEQQIQIDIQAAIENVRIAGQAASDARRERLEAVRLAKEVLIENARSKPVDARDVNAADITAFANTLVAYIAA